MQIISYKMLCILDRYTLSNERDLYFYFENPQRKIVHNNILRIALSVNELSKIELSWV